MINSSRSIYTPILSKNIFNRKIVCKSTSVVTEIVSRGNLNMDRIITKYVHLYDGVATLTAPVPPLADLPTSRASPIMGTSTESIG